ncbi:MAG: sensor histidine kinase [Lachnospiraceae bacterium]|nr:sensor histidine kinase [Lachnospiraceae bacterium]
MELGFTASSPDIPRLYTAIAEWGACLIYCLVLPRKRKLPEFIVISMVSFILLGVFMVMTGGRALFLWIPFMFIAFSMMYVYIFLCTSVSHRNVLYYTLRAFLLSEFTASLTWQLIKFAELSQTPDPKKRFIVLLIIYPILGFIIYKIEKPLLGNGDIFDVSKKDILAALLITAIAFSFSNISFLLPYTPFSALIKEDIFYIRTIVDLAGIAVLYAFQSRVLELQRASELAAIQKELTSQYDGYRNYQEMIGLINVKYHDLKHQIAALIAEEDPKRREARLYEMEGALEHYRPEHLTGNQVLDTILAGKSIRMKQTSIRFTCVADGSLLGGIHVSDVCSIFGNALDNAIEYEAMIPDPTKRMIHLTVAKRQGFIFIETANYCEESIPMKNGIPVTTKADRKNHGYGVKSIMYSAEKYGGTASFRVIDRMFRMQVLIPQK